MSGAIDECKRQSEIQKDKFEKVKESILKLQQNSKLEKAYQESNLNVEIGNDLRNISDLNLKLRILLDSFSDFDNHNVVSHKIDQAFSIINKIIDESETIKDNCVASYLPEDAFDTIENMLAFLSQIIKVRVSFISALEEIERLFLASQKSEEELLKTINSLQRNLDLICYVVELRLCSIDDLFLENLQDILFDLLEIFSKEKLLEEENSNNLDTDRELKILRIRVTCQFLLQSIHNFLEAKGLDWEDCVTAQSDKTLLRSLLKEDYS